MRMDLRSSLLRLMKSERRTIANNFANLLYAMESHEWRVHRSE